MALINGNLPLAIRLSKQALEYGENYSFRYQLAKLYFQNGEQDKALFEIERAVALRPNKKDAQMLKCQFTWAKNPKARCSY
jgi:tetratricopeptide (TPR) repeat protein